MVLGYIRSCIVVLSVVLLVSQTPVQAQSGSFKSIRQRGEFGAEFQSSSSTNRITTYTPVTLDNGSTLQLTAPRHYYQHARTLGRELLKTYDRFEALFGEIPRFRATVKLMDEEDFYKETGAPRWTNAMYYRGEIIIPLEPGKVDETNLIRSVKHEFTHAVIHALSDGKCPGWLDEGIAQWIEGDANPALKPALANWLQAHKPVPFRLLQGGFTKLKAKMVPAAYAQSLFAAKDILNRKGKNKFTVYFENLRSGLTHPVAFQRSFGLSERSYEAQLASQLRSWLVNYRRYRL